MNLSQQPFGVTPDGAPVDQYILSNDNGMTVKIMTYGGIITHLLIPDKKGKAGDIVHGFDNFEDYLTMSRFYGCITGRFANRIAGGKFTLAGKTYQLAQNNGQNHLHGGIKGFDKVLWTAKPFRTPSAVGVKLSYLSQDGEENYPGNLAATVTYSLSNQNTLKIEYAATTDQPTILNLTNHTYFNLAGKGDILGHEMMLNCDHFTPTDAVAIPTGELRSVAGTPLDFRQPTVIGARIDQDDEQLKFGIGYDHNWVVNGKAGTLRLAAVATEKSSGRRMEVLTTQPGIQFYSGNFLDGSSKGKKRVYHKRTGFCLETQHFPDSPNHPTFPSTVLNPGEEYAETTVFKFGVV